MAVMRVNEEESLQQLLQVTKGHSFLEDSRSPKVTEQKHAP